MDEDVFEHYKQDFKGQWMRLSASQPGYEKYCATCNIWRPPRASHCNICGFCMVCSDATMCNAASLQLRSLCSCALCAPD